MSKVTGTTVAAVRDSTNAQLDAKAARFDAVEKENADLKAALSQLAADNSVLAAAVRKLTKEGTPAKPVETIEIVAVPPEGVAMPERLVYDGVTYEAEIKEGFAHFKLPLKNAEVLLTDTSRGWSYRLTGCDEPITVKRRAGRSVEDVRVLPHVLDRTSKGDPFWKPVEVEESK